MTYIRTGTITATNGSKVIAGSGTRFITDQILVGDAIYIGAEGVPYDVTSVNSETSLGIAVSYTGTTGAGKKYVVMPVQGHNHDLAMRARDLILSYNEGVSRPVIDAELALKADKTDARLTDAREWAAATISQAEAEGGSATTRRAWTSQRVKQAFVAFFGAISSSLGRTLIGRATPSLMRTDLELGDAATLDTVGAGKVVREGAGGLLSNTSAEPRFSALNKDDSRPNGFYGAGNGVVSPFGEGASILTIGCFGSSYQSQIGFSIDSNDVHVRRIADSGGGWLAPYKFYTTANTAVLGTGAIHVASPILKLKTDSFEVEGFTKDCNPAATRKSKGVYEITGTQGLRSDGWYIETPADRNGNKYFNVEWSQNIEQPLAEVETPVDGVVVTISVFERAWNPATGLHENGAPIDINDLQSRWIDLRFNEVMVKPEEPSDENQ